MLYPSAKQAIHSTSYICIKRLQQGLFYIMQKIKKYCIPIVKNMLYLRLFYSIQFALFTVYRHQHDTRVLSARRYTAIFAISHTYKFPSRCSSNFIAIKNPLHHDAGTICIVMQFCTHNAAIKKQYAMLHLPYHYL